MILFFFLGALHIVIFMMVYKIQIVNIIIIYHTREIHCVDIMDLLIL